MHNLLLMALIASYKLYEGTPHAVEVEIKTGDNKSGIHDMWGRENQSPKRAVLGIEVFCGARSAYVPASAFIDLGEPGDITVKPLPLNGFKIEFQGGDGAYAYLASLVFDAIKPEITSQPSCRLVSKTVEPGEQDSCIPTERTTYRYPQLACNGNERASEH